MFNVEFLHEIRDYELAEIERHLPKSGRILEIGGGTGFQAKQLAEHGYDIESIDVPDGDYTEQRVFPVRDYDGTQIPFPDASFNTVFSSNVLEHVLDLPGLDREIHRVLKPGGFCVHVMPTGAWRWWTNIAHYVELVQRVFLERKRIIATSAEGSGGTARGAINEVAKLVRHYVIVPRHGETGNALTEIYTFSKAAWLKTFRSFGYRIESAKPLGLYYTGHMVFGKRIPIPWRIRLAGLLGSACVIYTVVPPEGARKIADAPSEAVDVRSAAP